MFVVAAKEGMLYVYMEQVVDLKIPYQMKLPSNIIQDLRQPESWQVKLTSPLYIYCYCYQFAEAPPALDGYKLCKPERRL